MPRSITPTAKRGASWISTSFVSTTFPCGVSRAKWQSHGSNGLSVGSQIEMSTSLRLSASIPSNSPVQEGVKCIGESNLQLQSARSCSRSDGTRVLQWRAIAPCHHPPRWYTQKTGPKSHKLRGHRRKSPRRTLEVAKSPRPKHHQLRRRVQSKFVHSLHLGRNQPMSAPAYPIRGTAAAPHVIRYAARLGTVQSLPWRAPEQGKAERVCRT